MLLFSIGQSNYSTNIIKGSYEVNEYDEREEWVDANYITHKYGGRTRIRGSFDLMFMKLSQYQSFLADLSANKNLDGTYLATLYVNNKGTAESIKCYLTFEAGLEQDSNLLLRVPAFTVEVLQQ
jgi:hypothetical protein